MGPLLPMAALLAVWRCQTARGQQLWAESVAGTCRAETTTTGWNVGDALGNGA